jgi:arylsulfatase A-like enzyme
LRWEVVGLQFQGSAGHRRHFLKALAAGTSLAVSARAEITGPPNIVLIMADDLGYGDLSCYGSKIQTPCIDRLAQEGIRFTQFNSASPVCSPSRASWLTGRYPTRVGIPRVLSETDTYGLPASETTMAQMLKNAGYGTACVGKWHLGSVPEFMPTNRGFDEFFGIPYSTDQGKRPLMQGLQVLEAPANLDTLTQRYTQYAAEYIKRSKDNPFFLYLAHSFPHPPFGCSSGFAAHSNHGMYGDMVQEIDWSVGKLIDTLQANGLDNNTLVMVSSDHGPWYQGSPGGLRGRKGESYEGGVRVPFVARYPAWIPSGQVCSNFAATLDIVPTVAGLTGAPLPSNPVDGVDIRPLLAGQQGELPRDVFLYFNDMYVQAARSGSWKLHLSRWNSPPFTPVPAEGRFNQKIPPELYDVVADVDESHDRAMRNPSIVSDIQTRVATMMQSFPWDVQAAWNATFGKQ